MVVVPWRWPCHGWNGRHNVGGILCDRYPTYISYHHPIIAQHRIQGKSPPPLVIAHAQPTQQEDRLFYYCFGAPTDMLQGQGAHIICTWAYELNTYNTKLPPTLLGSPLLMIRISERTTYHVCTIKWYKLPYTTKVHWSNTPSAWK